MMMTSCLKKVANLTNSPWRTNVRLDLPCVHYIHLMKLLSYYYTGDHGYDHLQQGFQMKTVCNYRNEPTDNDLQNDCFAVVVAKHVTTQGVERFAHVVRLLRKSSKLPCEVYPTFHSRGKSHSPIYDTKQLTRIVNIDHLVESRDFSLEGLSHPINRSVFDYLISNESLIK
jgi:hypothetical protein